MKMKGFFLSLVSLILLFYAITSITIKSNAVIQSEKTYEEAIRAASYQLILSQFDEDGVKEMLTFMSQQALYKLANHTALNPLKRKGDIPTVIKLLVKTGCVDRTYFDGDGNGLCYNATEMNGTLDHIKDGLNVELNKIGFNIDTFNVSLNNVSETLNESGFPVVSFLYDVNVSVSDLFNKSRMQVSLNNINISVSIEGMPDPLLNRFIYNEYNTSVMRFILFNQNEHSLFDNAIDSIDGFNDKVEAAQGWFYGPIVSVDEADSINKPYLYALYGNFDDINNYPNKDSFGAWIILGKIEHGDEYCEGGGKEWKVEDSGTYNRISKDGNDSCKAEDKTTKPFVVINMKKDKFENIINTIDPSQISSPYNNKPAILFISSVKGSDVEMEPWLKNKNANFYALEILRDNIACGNYFVGFGPSFLHRMLKDWNNTMEEDFADHIGIYTTITEHEFLGRNKQYTNYSSIGYEFMLQYEGRVSIDDSKAYYVRGGPGCKFAKMCRGDADIAKPFIVYNEPYSYVYSLFNLYGDLLCKLGDSICTEE